MRSLQAAEIQQKGNEIRIIRIRSRAGVSLKVTRTGCLRAGVSLGGCAPPRLFTGSCVPRSRRDDRLSYGVEHDFGGVVQAQFLHEIRAVGFDRVGAEA